MAVNEDIYKTKYSISSNGRELFTTTERIDTIIKNNPDWQNEQIWDSSNVFTTYDPGKYDLGLFGSRHTNVSVNYDKDPPHKIIVENSGENNSINLRYVFIQNFNLQMGGGSGFLWRGLEEFSDTITKEQLFNGQSITYSDPLYHKPAQTKALSINQGGFPLNISSWYLVNSINRNNMFYLVTVTFGYYNTANNTIVNIDIPTDHINQQLQFSEGPYIEYDGHQCFITNIRVNTFVLNQAGDSFEPFTNCNSRDVESGATNNLWSNNVGCTMPLYIICEKIIDGRCYYYCIPMNTEDNVNFMITYARGGAEGDNNITWTSRINPWALEASMTFNRGLTLETGNLQMFSMHDIPSVEMLLTDMTPSNGKQYINNDESYYNTLSTGGGANEYFAHHMFKIISVREVFRMFACSLIPFKICGNNDVPNIITSETENTYVGVRGNHGIVEGDYNIFVLGETPLDTELRPDDFQPIDPENPFPPNPDNDTGDVPIGTIDPLSDVTAFVHSYIMDAYALSTLGESLWGGINSFDPSITSNMVDNFFLSRRSDAAVYDLDFTLSNLIDYFVSLRYYPIPNIVNYAQSNLQLSQDYINVGTGVTPIKTVINEFKGSKVFPVLNNVFLMDGGTVTVPSSGRFTDFEPNTSISLYVPFCGSTELMPSQITGSVLTLSYCVDLTTGEMLAICYKNGFANFPVAILNGKIGFEQIISGNNAQSQSIAASIGRQQFTNRQLTTLFGNSMSAVGQAVKGDWPGAVMGLSTGAFNSAMDIVNYNLGFPLTAGSRPLVTGGASSVASMLCPQVAFLQIIKHNPLDTDQHGQTYGKMCNVWGTIRSQNGFIQVQNPKLEIEATQTEINEIHTLLQSGVFV